MFLNFYYRIKPVIPRSTRLRIRGMLAKRKLARVRDHWPILPGSERLPEGWPGWPHGNRFALVLTHDVESSVGLACVRPLAELEMKLGLRSSFNFVPEGDYHVSKELRHWLTDNGFEIGVHDLHHDGKLFRSQSQFSARAPLINYYLKEWNSVGFRSAFMLRNLNWIHDLDIAYDMSTFDTDPFEPQPKGMDTIFPLWVARPSAAACGNNQPSPIHHSHPLRRGYVELPYTLPQDSTLFLLLKEKSTAIWESKLKWLCSHRGMVLMNVHPDYIDFSSNRYGANLFPAGFYEDFLRKVSNEYQGEFWNPKPCQVANWYSDIAARDSSAPSASSRPSDFSKSPSAALAGKRAAVVLYSYYPSDSRPRRAAESMVQSGMHVELICLRESQNEAEREVINGVNVRRVPIERTRGSKFAYIWQYSKFVLTCLLVLGRRSLQQHFDIVHAHNMPDFLVFSALLPKFLGARVILDLHDPMPELMQSIYQLPPDHRMVSLLKALERLSIAFADLVLTPNLAFRDLFVSRGCPPGKIGIVMNSPEATLFDPTRFALPKPPGQRNGSFKLMFHGLIAERHGLDTAIEAVFRLRNQIRGLEFHIFGSRTAYMDRMTQLVQELDLHETVWFHGAKTQEEIAQALATVDLGIIPNRRNPFTEINMPTRIFENLAMGRPVIVPNTKGIRDYFNEKQLVFFDPGSVESLANAIYWIYTHPRDAQGVVAQGRHVLQAHTWELERQHFLECVRDLTCA
jgi:glycosyltransferase involved in cell wall biosynthesis